MKWLLVAGVPAILGGGIYLHGPLRTGEIYDHSAESAYKTISAMPLPNLFDRMVAQMPGSKFTKERIPGKSVIWHFNAKGKEVARFTADILPAQNGKARVATHFAMSADAARILNNEDSEFEVAKAFEVVGRVAMTEQVDSKLEKRPFEDEKVGMAMTMVVGMNMGRIQRTALRRMDEAADDMEQSQKANRQLEQQRKVEEAARKAGKPMTDVSKY